MTATIAAISMRTGFGGLLFLMAVGVIAWAFEDILRRGQ